MSRQSQQTHHAIFTILVTSLKCIFLLIKTERTVSTQLNTDGTLVTNGFHHCPHLLPGIQRCLRGNGNKR